MLKDTDCLIGGCRIEIRSAANGSGDLGYVLDRRHWGHGYTTEATRALVAFGFGHLALHRIWATCDVDNHASARVLEKLGMRREGRPRQSVRRRGEWRDSYLYATLQPEWRDNSPRDSETRRVGLGHRSAVGLRQAAEPDVETLRRLMQLYLYDLAGPADLEIGADGAFGNREVIEPFWGFGTERAAHLIHVDGKLAGFALTREGSHYGVPGTREVSEFFILRRYRGHGVGERVAVELFDRLPGRWEVRALDRNTAAQAHRHRSLYAWRLHRDDASRPPRLGDRPPLRQRAAVQ